MVDKLIENYQKLIRLQIGRPSTLDPVLLEETVAKEIIDNIYEKLIFYEGKSFEKFSPMLAESWDILDNGLEYIFYIRKGVVFHDGTLLNSFAVATSIRRMANLSKHDIVRQVIKSDNITIIDEYTIRIVLAKKFPGFLHLMASQEASIISPNILCKKNNEETMRWLENNSAGTGPFFLNTFDYNKIVLSKFKKYWREHANLEQVIILFEDNIEKRKNCFLNDAADIINDEGNDIDQYKKMTNVKIENNKSLDLTFIGFNLSKPYMQNLLFRKALAHSLDIKKYIQITRKGYGFETKGIIPDGLLGHTNKLPMYKYNLDIAKKYLQQCGMEIDNIPILKVLLPLGNGEDYYIRDYWKNNLLFLGLKVTIEYLPWQEFLNALKKGDFDIYSLAWAPDYPDPDNYIYQFLHSQGRISHYIRLKECYGTFVDPLIEDARFEHNIKNRELKYYTIQYICAEYCLYITLYQLNDIKVYKSRVKNVQYNPLYGDYYFYPLKMQRRGVK